MTKLEIGYWDLFTCPPRYSCLETTDVNSYAIFLKHLVLAGGEIRLIRVIRNLLCLKTAFSQP